MVDARHALALVVLLPMAGCSSASAHPTCGTPGDGGSVVLVAEGPGAQAIVVDATNVYWLETAGPPGGTPGASPAAPGSGRVLQCGKCNCDHPTVLASNETFTGSGIAVGATAVYWTNGDVMRVPIGGGEAVALAVAQTLGPVAVNATDVYWADNSGGLMKVPVTGGPAVTLMAGTNMAGTNVGAIALDAKNVYFVAGNAVFAMRLGGGAPKQLAQSANPQNIVVDSTSVYWTDTPLFQSGTIFKVPIAGGKPAMLASAIMDPFGLAVDATSVYWADGNTVMKVPVAGGTSTTFASGDATVFGVAVDATSVYWTNDVGSLEVMLTPK
jgi:hypothetical protein